MEYFYTMNTYNLFKASSSPKIDTPALISCKQLMYDFNNSFGREQTAPWDKLWMQFPR